MNEVGMGDISTALGYSSLDIGTLARYSGQNKWAKHKSFLYPAWSFASSSAEQTARASKNCGLVMKDYGNNWTLYAAMVANGAGGAAWLHDWPTGGSSAPYRMLDYLGYNTAAAAPFQFGLYPNPAYQNNSVRLSDEGGAGVADIAIADLAGDGTAAGNHSGYYYKNISSLNVGVMYGTSTTQPSAAYTLGPITSWSPIQNIPKPSSSGDYYAVAFFTDQTFSGTPTSTNGIFIPAPVGMRIWKYYDKFPFSDNGSYVDSLLLEIRLNVLQSISYTSLGVQFYKSGSWSSTVTLDSSSGTLSVGTYSARAIISPGYTDPLYFRMIVSGTADHQNYVPASTPTA